MVLNFCNSFTNWRLAASHVDDLAVGVFLVNVPARTIAAGVSAHVVKEITEYRKAAFWELGMLLFDNMYFLKNILFILKRCIMDLINRS